VQSLGACTVELKPYSHYGPYDLYRSSVSVQYSYNSFATEGRTVCTEFQCLYSRSKPLLALWAVQPVHSLSACRVELYLYCHCGPYGLYRALVPVEYSYTSIATVGRTDFAQPQCLYSTSIPLLPLWAVQSLQNLRACRVHLYLYCHCGPYGLCRASMPGR